MKLLLDYQRTRKFTLLIKRIPDNVKEISASIAFTHPKAISFKIDLVSWIWSLYRLS